MTSKIKQTQRFQELSKFIIFKTNINPTEYDPGAFQWIGYLLKYCTATLHSKCLFFCHFKYGSVETHGLSAQSCSLVSYFLYCAIICECVSVFTSATDKVDANAKVQRQNGERLKGREKMLIFLS